MALEQMAARSRLIALIDEKLVIFIYPAVCFVDKDAPTFAAPVTPWGDLQTPGLASQDAAVKDLR